jgi:hypothetical protein
VNGAMLGEMADRIYRLIVEGELSDNLESAFHSMTLTRAEGNTVLTGNVRDQAELQGLLRRVSDLGLTLLEARAIDDRPAGPAGDGPAVRTSQIDLPRREWWMMAIDVESYRYRGGEGRL